MARHRRPAPPRPYVVLAAPLGGLLMFTYTAFGVAPAANMNRLNCDGFGTQADALSELRADPTDPNRLDTDQDGVPCETRFGDSFVVPPMRLDITYSPSPSAAGVPKDVAAPTARLALPTTAAPTTSETTTARPTTTRPTTTTTTRRSTTEVDVPPTQTQRPVPEPEPDPPAPRIPTQSFGGVAPHVALVGTYLQNRFGVKNVQGVAARPRNPRSDHPGGLALDFPVDRATGDKINACVLAHKDDWAVKYVLWRVPDHYDHVHVSFNRTGTVRDLSC